jgi:hypothetical protein
VCARSLNLLLSVPHGVADALRTILFIPDPFRRLLRRSVRNESRCRLQNHARRALRMPAGFRSQIIRATSGILRNTTVSAQLPDNVPVNTIAALIPAGNAGS